MPIVPDYPCYCDTPWEDVVSCPVCGRFGGVLVCTDCNGLVDSCIYCEDDNE